MAVIPYLSQGIGVPIDPLTGLPKKKKTAASPYSPSSSGLGSFPGKAADNAYAGATGILPSSGGPITIPGYTPDYGSLIGQDALFGQLKLDLAAQGVSDAASRGSATQRALVQFGQVPQFDGLSGLNTDWLNQDVTPQARQLAQSNTDAGLSIAARQQKQFKDNLRAVKNALAARHALQSGETGYQLQEAQTGYDRARYDTTNELVDFIAGLQAGYAERQRMLAEQTRLGAESAYGRVVAANPTVGARTVYPNDPGYPGQPATLPLPPEKRPTVADPDWQDILIRTLRGGQASRAV